MSGLEALFKAPLTWMIFGAAGQLALAAKVRLPRERFWMLPPLVVFVCVLAALPTALGGDPRAYQIGMGFGLLFAGGATAASAPAALSGGVVLAITVTYWLSFILAGRSTWWGGFALLPAGFAAAPATFALVWLAATGARPERWLRFLLYLWALFALIVVGVMRFPYGDFSALEAAGRGWIVVLAAAYLGAHVAMLAHNALSLLALIPFPGENQSFDDRLKQVEAHASLLIDSFSPEPLGLGAALRIAAVQGALVWALSLWLPRGWGHGVHASLSLVLVATVYFARPPASGATRPLPTGGDLKREERRRRREGQDPV